MWFPKPRDPTTVSVVCGPATETVHRSLWKGPNRALCRYKPDQGLRLFKPLPLKLVCVLHSPLPFSLPLKPTEWSLCPFLWLGPISKLVCPVSCFAELVLQACSTGIGFMEAQGKPAVSGPSFRAFAWGENQVGGNWSFSFGSYAGVYCSNGRFHLVHTPRPLLAGSTSLEKENRLWSINGLPFKYQRLPWVRQRRPVGVATPSQRFPRPQSSGWGGCCAARVCVHAMCTHKPANCPGHQQVGRKPTMDSFEIWEEGPLSEQCVHCGNRTEVSLLCFVGALAKHQTVHTEATLGG